MRLWSFAIRDYNSADITYTAGITTTWVCVELGVAGTCACLPSMKPVFSKLRALYTKSTSARLDSRGSSPSDIFDCRLVSPPHCGSQPNAQLSSDEGMESDLISNIPVEADRKWSLGLDEIPLPLYPLSFPVTGRSSEHEII